MQSMLDEADPFKSEIEAKRNDSLFGFPFPTCRLCHIAQVAYFMNSIYPWKGNLQTRRVNL